MSKDNRAQPFAAAYVILRRDKKIAFLLRSHTGWMDGNFCLPSGKVDNGETFSQAAVREAKEEVGVSIDPPDLNHVLTGHRHEETEWVDVVFEAANWQGDIHNAEPYVHSTLEWLDPKNLPDNVVPSVRAYIEAILEKKNYTEYSENLTS